MIYILDHIINVCKCTSCSNSKEFNLLKNKIKFEHEWFSETKNIIFDYKISDNQIKELNDWSKTNFKKKMKIKNPKIRKKIVILNNLLSSTKEYIVINITKLGSNPINGCILKFKYKILNTHFKTIETDTIWIKPFHKNKNFFKFHINEKTDKKLTKSGINLNSFIYKLMNLLKNRTIISFNKNTDIYFLHWYISAYLFDINDNDELNYWKKYFSKASLDYYINHISIYDMKDIIMHINFITKTKIISNDLYMFDDKSRVNNHIEFYNVSKTKEIFVNSYKKIKLGKTIW